MTFPGRRSTPWPFAGQLRILGSAMLLAMSSLLFTDWIGRALMEAAFVVGAVAGFGILRVWWRLEMAPTE